MKKLILLAILIGPMTPLIAKTKKGSAVKQPKTTLQQSPIFECNCPNLETPLKKFLRDGHYLAASEVMNSGPQLTDSVLQDLKNPGVADEVFKTAFNNAHLQTINTLIAHNVYPKDFAQQVFNDFFKAMLPSRDRLQPKALANMQTLLKSDAVQFLDLNAKVKNEWSGPDPVLAVAIRKMQVPLVEALLAAGADPNTTAASQMTPLIEMAHTTDSGNKVTIAKALISAGADINKSDMYQRTPLHYAVLSNNASVVDALLEQSGIEVDAKDELDRTPLAYALLCNEMLVEKEICTISNNIAKKLITHGADINAPNKESLTPLMIAMLSGNATGARMLIDAGVDLKIKSNKGMNALAYANAAQEDVAIQALAPLIEEKMKPQKHVPVKKAAQQ